MLQASTLVGGVGVTLLLLAFVLNVSGRLRTSWMYAAMNFVGAGLAAYAAYLIDFLPFLLLEAVWCAAAAAKLVNLALVRRRSEADAPESTAARV